MAAAKVSIKRHALGVRLCHWINVLALFFLLVSGLTIFNAHPALYWGQKSTFAAPWLSMKAEVKGEDLQGVTRIGGLAFNTTGVLGRSRGGNRLPDSSCAKGGKQWMNRGFPAWVTLPSCQNLAAGRNWHLFFAWVFAINGLIYLITGFLGRHLTRDVIPSGKDLATVLKDPHLRLKFSKGPSSARYHQMQKIAYAFVVLILLPVVALSGMTMSPGLDAAFPFLLDLFGGRQSARSIHFICMVLIVGFVFVHLLMVIASGPINQVRAMITGKLSITPDADEEAQP